MQQESTAAEATARLEHLEQEFSAPLSAEQRQSVLEWLGKGGNAWPPEVVAAIPDGTEPGFIFRPYRPIGGRDDE